MDCCNVVTGVFSIVTLWFSAQIGFAFSLKTLTKIVLLTAIVLSSSLCFLFNHFKFSIDKFFKKFS